MNKRTAPDGTIRAALRYPAFRKLLGGLAVSQIGDWLYNLALVTLVYSRTHSALWAGITTAARVVPIVALGPLGGAIADRFDRRRVMIACDVIRLALMLLLALIAVTGLPILLAPVVAAAATAASSPYLACTSAVTPRLVPDADLAGANAARSAVGAIGIIAGPALGGVLLLVGSPALAFVVNAVTFGVAAVAVLAIPAGPAFQVGTAAERPTSLRHDLADGAAALRAHPEAVRIVGADIMCSLVYGMQTVLLLLAARHAGLGLHGYGYLFAGIGAGALIGTSLAGRVTRLPHPRAVLIATLAAVGLPMLILPWASWAVLAIALAATTGAGAILVEILTETALQRSLPAEVFGRAYGLALPASVAGIAVGSLIAPLLVSALGGTGAMVASGGAVVAYAMLLLRGAGSAVTTEPVPGGPAPVPAPAMAEEVLVTAEA
ncbi:MAG TPA: MFS transporter [Streptosporangiaceae bacterium]|jgi:MFS family permease